MSSPSEPPPTGTPQPSGQQPSAVSAGPPQAYGQRAAGSSAGPPAAAGDQRSALGSPAPYAKVPYISPFERPEVLAARPKGNADVADRIDVVGALLLDVCLIVGLVTWLAPNHDPATYGLAWVVLRLLPLCIAGTSPGGLLVGISVRGPEFGWANPVRVLLREALVPLFLLGLVTDWTWSPEWGGFREPQSQRMVDGRMFPDVVAGTWTIDRAAAPRASRR